MQEVSKMTLTLMREKKIKDLTVEEFKHLLQESIAEDVEAWKETFEIMADKTLMRQINNAERARAKGKNPNSFCGKK